MLSYHLILVRKKKSNMILDWEIVNVWNNLQKEDLKKEFHSALKIFPILLSMSCFEPLRQKRTRANHYYSQTSNAQK